MAGLHPSGDDVPGVKQGAAPTGRGISTDIDTGLDVLADETGFGAGVTGSAGPGGASAGSGAGAPASTERTIHGIDPTAAGGDPDPESGAPGSGAQGDHPGTLHPGAEPAATGAATSGVHR